MEISKESFGITKSGQLITSYTIKNSNNIEVKIINYGATITSILTPDKNNALDDIVLGFDSLKEYQSDKNPYFGATCGRYANRIRDGKFSIENKKFQLAKNDNGNSLHGGIKGFDKHIWDHDVIGNKIVMKRLSPDGEEGFPGNLAVEIYYSLSETNELKIEYTAQTDKPTIVNLTNHSYFNLLGRGNILDHRLRIYGEKYTAVNDMSIPTGDLKNVENSEMDILKEKSIGKDIKLVQGLGYDHNYCIDQKNDSINLAAEIFEPYKGRTLTCLTTEPGLQFYTGNYLNNLSGKNGIIYDKYSGFCLETQHYPDSPNQPSFPSSALNPGEDYHSICIYKFGVKS